MVGMEVEAFLSHLANEHKVSVSTHHQAISAILFLYKEVLGIELPWMQGIGRPQSWRRIPAVLTMQEVQALLDAVQHACELAARFLRWAMAVRLKMRDLARKISRSETCKARILRPAVRSRARHYARAVALRGRPSAGGDAL
jgi:site-specific recombinase XerD